MCLQDHARRSGPEKASCEINLVLARVPNDLRHHIQERAKECYKQSQDFCQDSFNYLYD